MSEKQIRAAVEEILEQVEEYHGEDKAEEAAGKLILAVPYKPADAPDREEAIELLQEHEGMSRAEARKALRGGKLGVLIRARDVYNDYYMSEGDLAILYGKSHYNQLAKIQYWRPEELQFNKAFALDSHSEAFTIAEVATQIIHAYNYGDAGGGALPWIVLDDRNPYRNPTLREQVVKLQLENDVNAFRANQSIQRQKVSDLVRAASNPSSRGVTPRMKAARMEMFDTMRKHGVGKDFRGTRLQLARLHLINAGNEGATAFKEVLHNVRHIMKEEGLPVPKTLGTGWEKEASANPKRKKTAATKKKKGAVKKGKKGVKKGKKPLKRKARKKS